MKILSFSLIALIAATLLLAIPGSQEATGQEASAVPKWEYKVLPSRRGSATEEELNKLGEAGWELVAVRSVGTAEAVFYFKRRK